ncbi:MAG: cellulase family glycosylhydrolase [Chloroflexia bacterium]
MGWNLAQQPTAGRQRKAGRDLRRLGLLAIPLLLIALVGETILFAPLDGSAAAPPRSPEPLPLAAVDPLGAHTFLEREVDPFKKQKTGEKLHDSGLRWIRQEFPWSELEFKKGVFFDEKNSKSSWEKFDDIMRLAAANGVQVIARLDRTPDWARQAGVNSPSPPPKNVSDFGDFVAEFVRHYNVEPHSPGKIRFLQIWNEPNLEAEWTPGKPVSAADYGALLKEAATRARAVDPNVVILSAPLATTNESFRENKPPGTLNLRETTYLAEMYAAGAAPYFDIASANTFGVDSPPEADPSPDAYNFRRVEAMRAVMAQNHDEAKPVWFTEYGWNAPDSSIVDPKTVKWGHVTPEQQADYTVRGIEYARTHWAWAGVFVIWYFRQVGDQPPTDAEYYFAMLTPDFAPLQLYNAVQAEAARLSVAGVGSYGPLSAPARASADWTTQLVRAAPGGSEPSKLLLVSQKPDATLDLAFRGTDLTLALASPAAGTAVNARIYVTVDGGTNGLAPGLPQDDAQRPYIAANQAAATGKDGTNAPPQTVQIAQLPVVAGLGSEGPPGVHHLTLRTDGPGATVAGFTVASSRSYGLFAATTGIILVALAADILFVRRARRRVNA